VYCDCRRYGGEDTARPLRRETVMKPTVLGVYDSYANARSAQRMLGEGGVAQTDIVVYSISVDAPREKGPRVYAEGAPSTHHHKKVFDQLEQLFARIFTKGAYPSEAEDYREFVRRGGTLVSVDIAETQIDLALEAMRRTGAADIEDCAIAWRTGAAKTQSAEQAAHPVSATASNDSTPHEATRGKPAETPAAAAVQAAPSPATSAAKTEAHAAPFSVAETNAAAGLRQAAARAEARANPPTLVEKLPKSQSPLATGFMGDPGLGSAQDDAYPDENEFRKDYDAHYANTGASYDEFRRAYSHGATLGRDERFRGADWQGVEASARANWEARYPESGWERFKTAVKHGWERVTRGG
jgi:hypothetical protein